MRNLLTDDLYYASFLTHCGGGGVVNTLKDPSEICRGAEHELVAYLLHGISRRKEKLCRLFAQYLLPYSVWSFSRALFHVAVEKRFAYLAKPCVVGHCQIRVILNERDESFIKTDILLAGGCLKARFKQPEQSVESAYRCGVYRIFLSQGKHQA